MKRSTMIFLAAFGLILASLFVYSGTAHAAPPDPTAPQTNVPTGPVPAGPNGPAAPSAQTGCLSGTNSGQTVYGSIGGTAHNPWGGVLLTTIGAQTNVPAFCTDLMNGISIGDCFNAGGPTTPQIAYILRHYPPQTGLTNAEAAARQAAVWWYSDVFTVTSGNGTTFNNRVKAIISDTNLNYASDPALQVPQISIAPSAPTSYIPGGEAIQYTVTAVRGGNPFTGKVINLLTNFGTLSSPTVTTGPAGTAIFTVTSNSAGSASISASLAYTLPAGTELNGVVAGKQKLVLGKDTPGTTYAGATGTWVTKTTPTISTQRSGPTSGTFVSSVTISDTVFLTGTGSIMPAGTVQFFLCQSANGVLTPPNCSTGGSALGAAVAVAPNGTAKGTASSINVHVAGGSNAYCFRAEFTPAAGSAYLAVKHSNTVVNNPAAECFIVSAPTAVTVSSFEASSTLALATDGALAGMGLAGILALGAVALLAARKK